MSYASLPHLRSNGGSLGQTVAPTHAAGAGAGASPTITVTGADERGQVAVTTGASGEAAGTLVTLTFQTAYTVAPDAVLVSANDSATAALNPYASVSATGITIGVQGAPAASTAYKFNYVVLGGS